MWKAGKLDHSWGTYMNLSRLSLLAVAVSMTSTGLAGAQGQQSGVVVSQPRPQSTEDLKTILGGKTLRQWIAEISSPDPSRRENAIRTVVLMKGSQEAIPALIERVERDGDSSPRVNAIIALGAVPMAPDEDVSKIVAALRKRLGEDSQSIIRFQAALVLGRFGGKSRSARTELIRATKDQGSWEIRKAAVFALTRAEADVAVPVNSQAIEAIVARLSQANESSALVRLEAAMSIATIGRLSLQDHKLVSNALAAAERDHEKMVGIWARVGLAVHENKLTKEDMNTLIKFLENRDLPARTHAARAIGTIASLGDPGPLIKPAVPALMSMLDRDSEELAKIAAIWALGRIGRPSEPALKRLNELLADKKLSEEGRNFIKEAIDMIQGKGKN
ncbi:MAG TPA: HEAT repeat domain-containing protein [Gemmataceae bacterium]|nr:HEAT repeat domain-containing protein [Gemmataceae bacterium]